MTDDEKRGRLSGVRDQLNAVDEKNGGSDPEVETEQSKEAIESEDSTADSKETPAFPYAECTQESIYPRQEIWDKHEYLELDVKQELRTYDVRGLTGRELDDAIIRLATENPERIAELVMEARNVVSEENQE